MTAVMEDLTEIACSSAGGGQSLATLATGTASLLDELLAEQQSLTAAEQFSRWHDERKEAPDRPSRYADLIPAGPPGAGQQYAFEVDLDSCSGCKACVTACHNLNGLEEDETWRSVGLLHGGSAELPIVQHVTTACHHCLDPACLEGCPVLAYEKDPATGIVRHLDDQCIGCQYCMLKCPYDVPRYSHKKGIVRKCDMCHQRLAAEEAPACVQACPNEAIRITLVDRQTILEESEGNHFLPGAPEPGYTLPTTVYKTKRPLPRNLLPADYYAPQPGHGHVALVVMLVLTQMSVGGFVVEQLLGSGAWSLGAALPAGARPWHLASSLLLGFLGLGAAVFHLGRPWIAYRALLGLRTSWLSREILGFGLFAGLAAAYVAAAWLGGGKGGTAAILGWAASLAGVGAVFCSVMIYVDTRRECWRFGPTTLRFALTCIVLGLGATLLVCVASAAWSPGITLPETMNRVGRALCGLIVIAAGMKLLLEAAALVHLRDRRLSPLKRSALVMTGPLGMFTLKRFFVGVLSGLVLPLILLGESVLAPHDGFHPLFIGITATLMVVLMTVGELLERYLFFAASVAPKMPGAQVT